MPALWTPRLGGPCQTESSQADLGPHQTSGRHLVARGVRPAMIRRERAPVQPDRESGRGDRESPPGTLDQNVQGGDGGRRHRAEELHPLPAPFAHDTGARSNAEHRRRPRAVGRVPQSGVLPAGRGGPFERNPVQAEVVEPEFAVVPPYECVGNPVPDRVGEDIAVEVVLDPRPRRRPDQVPDQRLSDHSEQEQQANAQNRVTARDREPNPTASDHTPRPPLTRPRPSDHGTRSTTSAPADTR